MARVPTGQDPSRYGIDWDVNDAVGQRRVDVWLSDRSRAEGRWADGIEPVDLLLDRRSPLLMVAHPNNWCPDRRFGGIGWFQAAAARRRMTHSLSAART